MRANNLLILMISSVFVFCTDKTPQVYQNDKPENNPVFERLPSEKTQLVFSNTITENIASLENLFNYDYFYNGAGVGIEDLNNDGLLDIFFCGNQVANKLFVNRGNMTFEDISEQANINKGKIWANGVTFVDINSDGWMDIYVSQGGPNKRLQRKNLLFVNQQDGTFLELAKDYGLDDMGISTQSVFFDYDKDGDLDCLVMNENEYYGVDPIQLFQLVAQNQETQYFNSSHLYRNDNGKFKDVTRIAGLERPIFGLGLSISDINEDGWLDIYIASDYYIPDALFVNNQNGTFSDQIKDYTNQISFYGMGMDIADLNNDSMQDIFVLDMASNDHVRSKTLMASMNTKRFDYLVNKANFHHQYMFNSLQLNTGFNKFSNIAQAAKVANTDWSWSVLMSDFDHDQDKDIYITNGYRRYALDNDLQRKVFEAKVKYKNNVPLEVKQRLYEAMPSEKLPNILYEHMGDLEFKDKAQSWGLADFSFSNGAAMGDLDNDGDMDLVVNNMDENCFLYQNLTMEQDGGNFLKVKASGTLSESFPKVTLYSEEKVQFIETRRVRGYRSSHENVAHFGLGEQKKVDSVIVKWPNGRTQVLKDIESNTTVLVSENDASFVEEEDAATPKIHFKKEDPTALGIVFTHQENPYDDFEKEILLPYKQSTLGPFIAQGDFNGDQLEDLFVGGASGQAGALFVQTKEGGYQQKAQKALEADRSFEDMEAVAFDYENDGDLDLFVVSGGNAFAQYSSYYADRLYLNDGKGNLQRKPVEVLDQNTKSGKAVVALDYDKDGDMDILVGNRIVPQNYPLNSPSVIYENQAGKLIDVTNTIAPGLGNFGIVNSLVATDFDGDGWQDFIAVGEWTEIGLFKNEKGTFRNITETSSPLSQKGWWYSIKKTDINNDGLPDYLVGNVGKNIKFSASKEKPFKVYAHDFDDNGTPDIVLSKKYQGEYVPVRGRECSSQQMPFIQQKFETYSEFANAKLVDIYGEKLTSAYQAEATEFRSVLLLNTGSGKFEISYLPNEAQFFPIMESVFLDVNGDGLEDAIVAGNIYNTEVETPRLDAVTGAVLLSNGKDGYSFMPWQKSGLLLDGNIKDLALLNNKGTTLLFASQNNGSPIIYAAPH